MKPKTPILPPLALCHGHPECDNEITHDKTIWHNKDNMEVIYFCAEHAPADASLIEEDDFWEEK